MSALSTLFDQFLRERRYLKNVTPKTVTWYQTAFDALTRTVRVSDAADLSKPVLQEFVVRLRERGLAPVSCNTYVKGVNSFLAWLHAEGHIPVPLVLRPQRIEKRLVQTLTDEHLKRLVAYKPKTADQWRAYALACTLTDTGIRIEEAPGLRQGDVDHDNLLLKVRGKGRKERLVPFSFELRRVLFRWQQMTQRKRWASDWLFPTRAATKLSQRNALRAHYALLTRLGIPKSGFHRLRHTFATSYLQNGGDVVRLSRVLGHAQLTTTMRYLHLVTNDLQKPTSSCQFSIVYGEPHRQPTSVKRGRLFHIAAVRGRSWRRFPTSVARRCTPGRG